MDLSRAERRGGGFGGRIRELIRAIDDGDDALVEAAVLDVSRRRRWLAPLAFAVGAFVMLFQGVRLLLSNWRLTLVEILPAVWIWLATYDLKLHMLRGRSFQSIHGPVVILLLVAVTAITAACFFLNAVFGFAIAEPGTPRVRPAVARARAHATVIVGWGIAVGVALGVATTLAPRWGRWWFAVLLSVVIGVMTVAYVAIPARLVGARSVRSRRDQLSAGIIGGALTLLVCTPPYVLNRIAILMLGAPALFLPGIVLLTVGVTLQAGATGAVKALKMSTKLLVARSPSPPAVGDA